MGRRRRRSRDTSSDMLDMLYKMATKLPWYLDALLAVVSYIGFHYLFLKYQLGDLQNSSGVLFGVIGLLGQYVVTSVFIIGGMVSLWHSVRNSIRGRELLSQASSKDAVEVVSKMSWLDFELLIGTWFDGEGYEVIQSGGADTGSAHADGGIDIELRKNGELFLVQCKHYRSWKVSVETVRDLYGVMTSRGAAGGFVVTSGRFTEPAQEFAAGRSITLIDGEQLSDILSQTKRTREEPTVQTDPEATPPMCPKCSSAMVHRTAHRGENAGHEFWGCSRYPACKGIVPID